MSIPTDEALSRFTDLNFHRNSQEPKSPVTFPLVENSVLIRGYSNTKAIVTQASQCLNNHRYHRLTRNLHPSRLP